MFASAVQGKGEAVVQSIFGRLKSPQRMTGIHYVERHIIMKYEALPNN